MKSRLIAAAMLLACCLQTQAEQLIAGLQLKSATMPNAEVVQYALFYPAYGTAHKMTLGPSSPTVAFNAPVADDIKGLVLISHGTGGGELGHYDLAQSLAMRGYIVAALRHPGDNWQESSLISSSSFFVERPRQLSRFLDFLLADTEWGRRIPANKIGAIGHSAGGYTVLTLAGGVADMERLRQHCRTSVEDKAFCTQGKNMNNSVDVTGLDGLRDPRIKAVVALAPLGEVFTAASLSTIKLPVKLYVPQYDEILKPQFHGDWLHQNMPTASYEKIANAGHFAFLAPMAPGIKSRSGDLYYNPPGFDRDAFLQRLQQELPDFFDASLR